MLPNLNNEGTKAKNAPVVTFSYDNTSEETDSAMRTFQKLFGSKRGWIMTAAYIVMLVAASVLIAFNPRQPVLYLAVGLCVVFLTLTVSAPSRKRKKIIKRIESMPSEDYECELYRDKVIIKTFIYENNADNAENSDNADISDNTENSEKSDKPEEKAAEPVIQLLPFRGEYMLDFAENDLSLLLFVNGRQFFCFPKRCLTEEQQAAVRDTLSKSVSVID